MQHRPESVLRISWAALAALCCLAPVARAADAPRDCEQGRRYLAQAKERIADRERDAAISFLQQSLSVCPSYEAYLALGEQSAKSGNAAGNKAAVAAFVSAHELSRTSQEEAAALFQYGSLLAREGDPGNAFPLVNRAQQLDPGNAAIKELEKSLDARNQNPQATDLVRGLKDSLYQPLRKKPSKELPGGASPTAGPSVAIPIHFKTDSTTLDPESSRNLAVLARALTDPQLQGRQFLFIGHADARGDAARNKDLSLRRAQAVYDELLRLQPSLKGKVVVEGHGSAEPIDPRATADAYRVNRRLQVLLK